jgi:thiamine pyrophosphate-dependent acetolactate synthase large subunit-like protein
MKAIEAVNVIVRTLRGDEFVISANGNISRMLFSVDDRANNFYMLGSMGLTSSIGLGLALSVPEKRIIVLDGDGNILMNMGSLATIGNRSPRNLVHIVLDNETYESTGGQPTVSRTANLDDIAKACGFRLVERIRDAKTLRESVKRFLNEDGPSFGLVKIDREWEASPRVAHKPEIITNRFRNAVL